MSIKQDRLQRAKERFSDCLDDMAEQNDRIREDLEFSNPIAPKQWSTQAQQLRAGRPAMTFDNCNKFIFQVVNDGNASPPSIQTVPADGFAHAKAAEALNGRIRHIEYASRAQLAYGTSLDLSARCGLGWLHARPEILNPETNQQEPRIIRVKSPLECYLEAGWQEPDGSDAECGFMVSTMRRPKFKTAFPKANATHSWSDENRAWTTLDDSIVIANYYEVERKTISKLLVMMPDGEQVAMTEDEYWETAQALGFQPQVVMTEKGDPYRFDQEERTVSWSKMTGCEELEHTDFPSQYIPIVPVIGNELWIDNKRYLGGLTRQLMDGQRMHNAEMSSYTESILSQPKAPFMVPIEAIEGHDKAWAKLNSGNPAYLPYNSLTEDGQPIPGPSRMAPPQFPSAFAQGAVMGSNAMQNAVGVYKSGLGQDTANAVSGVAKQQDRRESNTATFHYTANRAISLQHLGRILIDMDRRLTDTARNVRTLGEDGEPGSLRYDPQLRDAVEMKDGKVVAINPKIGEYDLRVKVGPSYLTQNEETAAELSEMFRGAPQLLPVLGPLWVKLKAFPDADTVKKLLIAMAPEQIQAVYAEQDSKEAPVPPQAKAALLKLEGQVKQLSQALEAAAQAADTADVEREKAKVEREKAEADMLTKGYQAVTERMKVTLPMTQITPELMAMVQQVVRDAMAIPAVEADDVRDAQGLPELPEAPEAPEAPMQAMPEGQGMGQQEQEMPEMGMPDATDAGMNAPFQPATEES